ncbi:hypothetical protein AVEN_266893-1 [Araneus ventricosus]|uniref:Uncharacterized protein n=1 Tax=Araneus ventricosus TaxID=182803 RepID=A0A4Y2SL11_ARAVE|nr:hypothetical protein AVEN_266893-1 [Araneus ventricosus]
MRGRKNFCPALSLSGHFPSDARDKWSDEDKAVIIMTLNINPVANKVSTLLQSGLIPIRTVPRETRHNQDYVPPIGLFGAAWPNTSPCAKNPQTTNQPTSHWGLRKEID